MTNDITAITGYEVSAGEARQTGRSIIGEFILRGARGAEYLTYRRNEASTTFQFMRRNGVFVAVQGNKYLPVAAFTN